MKLAGSIELTRAGEYRVRFPHAGKRPTIAVVPTLEEAEAIRLAALAELEGKSTGARESLASYGRRFLEGRTTRDRAGEVKKWNHYVSRHAIGALDVGAVRRRHVLELLDAMKANGISRSMRAKILGFVRMSLGHALDRELVKTNVAADVKIPKEPRSDRCDSYLTIPQVRALYAALEPGFERAVVFFSIATGLREGELATLRLDDVHATSITVRYGSPPTSPPKRGEERGGPTKSKQIRDVELLPLALAVLEQWKPWLAPRANPHGLLFPRERGEHLDPKHVLRYARWRAIRTAIGRDDLRWHDLRHTAATALVSGWWGRDWSLRETQGMLGHTSSKTAEIYAHLCPTTVQNAGAETRKLAATQPAHSPPDPDPTSALSPATIGNHSGTPDMSRTCDLGFRKKAVSAVFPEVFERSGLSAGYAVALLAAVDAGDELEAGRLGDEIAGAVLSSTPVRLARGVLERGPLATAYALRLAGLALESTEGEGAALGATS